MPGPSLRSARFPSLFCEICARLPLFEDLRPELIARLSAAGLGRGLLTASLRARLRKAGFADLGQIAQSAPAAILQVRKFGPVRVEALRAFILEEIARAAPGARVRHAAEALAERRLARLREIPLDRLPLEADEIARLAFARTCADLAAHSRMALVHRGAIASADLDRLVTTLARFLGEGGPIIPAPAALPEEADGSEARRAASLAERDREWEEAAPARGRPRERSA
ncbi:hypothetical protein [Methylobacterium segetis]|uniref:hypothetical protein n=1 Tax=Methylobacterium segetis TaxID=2488750 RepID=UPI0014052E2D|nr:hypothetical protein [Methylobacterium segetis]